MKVTDDVLNWIVQEIKKNTVETKRKMILL